MRYDVFFVLYIFLHSYSRLDGYARSQSFLQIIYILISMLDLHGTIYINNNLRKLDSNMISFANLPSDAVAPYVRFTDIH